MTLPASSFASPFLSASVPQTTALSRGFAELDERVIAGPAGVLLVRATSADAGAAAGAHVGRRMSALGATPIFARARTGAPLWRDVASLLGLSQLPCDPSRCASEIAQAAQARHAVIIAALPAAGSWDRSVAVELSSLTSPPLVVFLASVTSGGDAAHDLRAEVFDIAPTLDATEVRRWWIAVADDAHADVATDEIAKLDAWWASVRRAPLPVDVTPPAPPVRGGSLFAALALAGRAWPASDLAVLGADNETLDALVRSGAVQITRGQVGIGVPWEPVAIEAAAKANASDVAVVASALVARFHGDPWAHAHAADLLLRAESYDAADRAHATALNDADDALARRELVLRWMVAVGRLPVAAQLSLRIRAAERALALGEAEEAHRWAQSAATLASDDATVTLLVGQAAVALGDLVAARVALERGRRSTRAPDDETSALIAVELAEVAYLSGELEMATSESMRALSMSKSSATQLKARNTLGKILLAEAKWDEADRHFAEDAWTASSRGEATAELRARLNRGIALLSKGLGDEARAIFDAVLTEGERTSDARACAYALDNLAVVATWRHDYAEALSFSERTLKLRQHLGDRLATARILANLAELRRKLGLLDHAEHAIAFGRRTLGPGMPAARSALFGIQAARTALIRGNTAEARREIGRAIVDAEAAGMVSYMGEAHRVATRIALADGDLARAGETLGPAREMATTDEARAEVALLAALLARASGENEPNVLALAIDALALARATGEEEVLIEAHTLLSELHRSNGNIESARAHVEQAMGVRDAVADTLGHDIRAAFLARPDVIALTRLNAILSDPEPSGRDSLASHDGPRTQRSIRGAGDAGQARLPRDIIGDDPAIRGLLAAVKKVARSNSTILIRGESGTGKELIAEAVHRASERAAGPLVTVNCAAFVETLLLSELFGHEKGAFTGAAARRRGRFELAEGGTLFLDEIGDVSARTQVALLRVLQERTFERVGGTSPIRANVRIICATHRDLRGMVERGDFREDLYYRLRGITLELPPLRARMGDLPRISEHLLARIAAERAEAPKSLASEAIDLLSRHRWPGNIRELENALRAASLFAEGEVITAAHLVENVDDLRTAGAAAHAAAAARSSRSSYLPPPLPPMDAPHANDSSERLVESDDDANDVDVDASLPPSEANATAVAYAQVRQGALSLSDMKRQIERDCIARALAETKGNITRAATLLGMKRPRLSQLVKQYGLAAVSSEVS